MLRQLAIVLIAVFLLPADCPARNADARNYEQLLSHGKIRRPEMIAESLIRGQGRANVIIGLKRPVGYKGMRDLRVPSNKTRLREAVEKVREPLLNRLAATEIRNVRKFDYLPSFAAEVTPSVIRRLLKMEVVEHITPDFAVHAHTLPELTLTDAVGVRGAYGGSGVSVAICDTGVNYNHVMLDDHYLGGYDFGDRDDDPMAGSDHGTPVAGIAVGEDGTSGNYVGGVAPEAGYYALKITPGSSGTTNSSVIIEAWEWAVNHKNDNPAQPIVAINTSFGTEYEFGSPCDYFADLFNMAQLARDNGILIFVSSGNAGNSTGIAAPACLSNVVSVGAVTDGDLVAGFSNTDDHMDVFAPGVGIYTTEKTGGFRSFSGTSASAPFAAGVAALFQSIHKDAVGFFLNAAQLEAKIEDYGVPVTDTRPDPDLTKPRTDVGATDIDGDGMPAGWEVDNFGDILTGGADDTDGDGLVELLEYQTGTDPNDPDSEDDGMPDGWESDNGLDPLLDDADEDPDGDGFTNLEEYMAGTDPQDDGSFPQSQTPKVPALGLLPAALAALFLLLLGAAASRRRS